MNVNPTDDSWDEMCRDDAEAEARFQRRLAMRLALDPNHPDYPDQPDDEDDQSEQKKSH